MRGPNHAALASIQPMTAQPPTPQVPPVQIVPWLAQPLTPLLWATLGVALVVAVAMLIGHKRSTERCPLSVRWLAIGTVIAVAGFAAISFGGQLANPVAVYAVPIVILVATLIALAAWHADGDQARTARVTAAALAFGSALATGCVLACAHLLRLATTNKDLDLDLGLGLAEAVAHLLPAVGVSVLPLLLLPASNPRTVPARRAVTAFAGLLILILTTAAVLGAAAITTPQPDTAGLADRYTDINLAVSIPPLLGAVCALAGSIAVCTSRAWQRLLVATFGAGLLLIAAWGLLGASPQRLLGLEWWQPAVCTALGLVVGLFAASLSPRSAPIRLMLAVAAVGVCIVLGGFLCAPLAQPGDAQGATAPNAFTAFAAGMLALVGLFASSAPTREPAAPASDGLQREPIAGLLVTACLLIGGLVLSAVTLRSELTYQARKFSVAYVYESNRQVDPEMRSILQYGPHAVHMGGSRWAWVMPQSIWWTRDAAWRDALIASDYTQPHTGETDPSGTLYQAVITGANRKRSDDSFTEAQYVALVKPVPTPQKSPITHTVAARFSTPQQLWGWTRLTLSNRGVWLGALLSLPAAWWLTRRTRTLTSAAAVSAGCILAVALLAGVAGVFTLLAGLSVLTLATAARRDDGWRGPTLLLMIAGVAAALMAVVIPLAEAL